jgi:hypothetical protein
MEKLVAVVNLVLANLVNDALEYISDWEANYHSTISYAKVEWDRYHRLKKGFLSCIDPKDQKMALDALREDNNLRKAMAAVARDFSQQLLSEGLRFHFHSEGQGQGPDGDILVISCFGEGADGIESVSLQLDVCE